ncbi:MAG: zinc ribbon domain-containing protein [Acidobacteriota bacterium]|nr:zinc ribbon domain-containing protein [Acidobacteriota bacterium]
MNNDGINYYQNTEHYSKRVLVGNVASVRHRLSAVLERLDYDFIDDEGEFEIQAKRNARGWAGAYASADVLDYPRTLIIKLKPLGDNSTRASFAYIVKHPSLNRGEKEVLTREAETIANLATIRATDKICQVCGTESTDDSRFCRKCGAPMTGDETALEVLRMTAEIRSGHTSVVTSAVIAAANALVTLGALLILTGSGAIDKKVFSLLLWSLALSVLGVLVIGFGWKRLNNAIKSNNKEQKVITGKTTPTLPDVETSALPPQPVSFSVTEETTELLNQNEETPAFVNRSHNKKT